MILIRGIEATGEEIGYTLQSSEIMGSA